MIGLSNLKKIVTKEQENKKKQKKQVQNKQNFPTQTKMSTDKDGNVTIKNTKDVKPYEGGTLTNAFKNFLSGKTSTSGTVGNILGGPLGGLITETINETIKSSNQNKEYRKTDAYKNELLSNETAIKKKSDVANENLKTYMKENNINLLNRDSKKVKNDKNYQKLLKEAQQSYKTYQNEKTKNSVENHEFQKGIVGGLEKTAYSLGGGFETGAKGVESTIKKILGQTPENDTSNYLEEMQSKARNETEGIKGYGLDIVGSIGQMIPQMMVGNEAGALATGFANYGGSAYNEAKKEGKTEEQAVKYGIVSGTLEMAMEKALGGFEKIYGKSALGKLTNNFSEKVVSKVIKNKAVRETLESATGEFTEEYLQEFLDPIIRNVILEEDNGADFWNTAKDDLMEGIKQGLNQFFNKENLTAGILGAVTSGIMEGSQNVARSNWSKQTGRDFETGYTENEQKVIDKVLEERIEEAQEEGKELTKKEINEIEKEVKEDLQKGNINTDTIENALGMQEYVDNYKNDNEMKLGRNLTEQETKELIDEAMNKFRKETDLSKDYYLQKSYEEKSLKSKEFNYDSSKITNKYEKATYESTKGKMNDTTKSHELVDAMAKMSKDRQMAYKITNNEELKQKGLAKEGKKTNGVYVVENNGERETLINIDSNKYLEALLVHETTHDFEKDVDTYRALKEITKAFAEASNKYEETYNEIKQLYQDSGKPVSQEILESETTARLLEDYLGNKQFITELTNQKPTIIQKLIDTIKYLKKQFSAGSKEQRKLNKIQHQLEQAYKEAYKTNKADAKANTKYDLSKNALQEVSDIVKQTREEAEKSNTQFVKLKDNTIKSLVDYGIKDLPMLERVGHVRENILTKEQAEKLGFSTKNKHYHGLGVKTYLEIIDSMDNPIAIYQYTKDGKYDGNNFIVVTPIEIDGKKSIVPVEINQKGQYNSVEIDFNKIKSSYLETRKDYLLKMLKDGKIKEIFTQSSAEQTSLVDNNISQKDISVNNSISSKEQKDTKNSLNERLSGDELLNAQDLIDEVKSVGAKVDKNGYITLYHQTTPENAKIIRETGKMKALENGVFFSTSKNAQQSEGKGTEKLEFKIPVEKLILDDLFDDNADLKIPLKLGDYLDISDYIVNDTKNTKYSLSEESNNDSFKEKQLNIINKSNPAPDEVHTWIRNIEDIKTFNEAFFEDREFSGFDPDFTEEMAKESIESGKIRIYSSYPIENGVFVSPSPLEASQYAGGDESKLYSKEVNINDVAWIDGAEGQYAKVESNNKNSLSNNNDVSPTPNRNKTTGEEVKLAVAPLIEKLNQVQEEINILKTNNSITKYDLTSEENEELNSLQELDNKGIIEDNEITRLNELLDKKNNIDPQQKIIQERLQKKREKSATKRLQQAIETQNYKSINEATKTAKKYLEFDSKEKSAFKQDIMKFKDSTMNELMNADTYNEVKNIVEQYANKEINYLDDELVNAQKEIRNYKIKISDELKAQITDFSDFRKDSKLKLSRKDGISVDKVWQELSESYPYYFSNEIQTQADIIYELSDFMFRDKNITEKYRLSDDVIKKATDKIYNSLLDSSISEDKIQNMQKDLEQQAMRKTRQVVQDQLLEDMGITIDDLQVGEDISSMSYQLTAPVRVNEKVFGYEKGQKINDATVGFINQKNAEKTRDLNKNREIIKELGIKARSKESSAVQKYAEKQFVNDKGEVVEYGDKELAQEFPNVKTQEKIKNASKTIRNMYDDYLTRINSTLVEFGYDPIPARKDYMRHFQEMTDIFSRLGVPLNRNDLNKENLPTDINGITDEFKPGKNYFANAQTRKGFKTIYDAITGIDGYMESASNIIYYTEAIQRYRTLSKVIRETYGQSKLSENLNNLSDVEVEQRIKDAYEGKLSNYVAWLDEQANTIAGKKNKIDRSAERMLGRKVYTILDTAKKQVGSNMTGFNVRSAMTNFASAIQGFAKTNPVSFVKGTMSTINNILHDDGLINKSDFLTNRFGSDTLSKKAWQKLSNAGQIFMTGTDYITSNQIWRGKYYEGLSKGLTEEQSIKQADDFSARVMGDRSVGQTAEIFNSKTLGLLSQFQLEVNNQWQSLFHDTKKQFNEISEESVAKATGTIVFQLGVLSGLSYLFNGLMKDLTGSGVMIDPIQMIKDIFAPDDEDDESTILDRATKVIGDLVDNLPFASILTGGGRIPMSEAFTGLTTGVKFLTGQKDKFGNDIELDDVGKDFKESLMYWLLPTGYSQIKKTTKGLSMYNDDLPISGSYTDSGNLRFTADESTTGKIKAGLFGQYSSKEAQEYIDSGFKSINKSKIFELKDLNMNSTEYRKYREGLSKAGTKTEDKIEYINNLNVSEDRKNTMASNILKREVDMSEYNKYGSYEEFDYASKNPEKYQMIISITDYDNYKDIMNEIKNITGDVNKYGKTISGSRKNKVISYVNSLNLSVAQKAMIIKQEYPSFTQYDNQIIKYINNKDMSFIEKASILKKLGFKSYDKQIINYIKNNYTTIFEQQRELEKLGFKIYEYNGRTYVR